MDINLFREDKGGNTLLIRESQRRRFCPEQTVDNVITCDATWRSKRYELDQANKAFAALNKKIADRKSQGQDASDLLAQTDELKSQVQLSQQAEKLAKSALDNALLKIGNIVHQSVPISQDEGDNLVYRKWGECRTEGRYLTHDVLLHMIDGFDPEHGSMIAGHRGYFLTGVAVALNQALIGYALSYLRKREYMLLQTPYFMNRSVMAKVAQLSQFDEELYKVSGDGEEKYLIATSEQPIAARHMNEWIGPKSLPIRYAGVSSCFRKEAGAHGRDVSGIFRVHQFEKVEQFVITSPEDSWEMQEIMLNIAESFHQSLGLPYQVVNIVSGELNLAAAKKYDVECWFPGSKQFRELVSCSNCTDYQSRRLEIRYGNKKLNQTTKNYVHMLNSTLCATGRAICCILENHQTEAGINVPEPLRPFMEPFLEDSSFIPFAHPLPNM